MQPDRPMMWRTAIKVKARPVASSRACAVAAFALLWPAATMAQQAYQPPNIPGVPPMLQRVESRVVDVSPLAEGLREINMQADFRAPVGFMNVYRVPGRDDLYMRASGGVYAVFPQSVYILTDRGMNTPVPPGTVFSIGMPSPWALPSAWLKGPELHRFDEAQSPNMLTTSSPNERQLMTDSGEAIDRTTARRDMMATTDEWTALGRPVMNPDEIDANGVRRASVSRSSPPEPATFLKTIVTDDAYRARRLATLMEQAAKASQSAASGH